MYINSTPAMLAHQQYTDTLAIKLNAMKVNEIFYSLQGEGRFTGTAATFVRLSGCNLKCDFCDTAHQAGREMTEDEIAAEVTRYPATHVVITGGEPTLQLTAALVEKLHRAGKFVQIETNGTQPLNGGLDRLIDWVTVSPKEGAQLNLQRIDELKAVYDMNRPAHMAHIEEIASRHTGVCYLQPCDRNQAFNRLNLASCIDYILTHPRWKLSLQTHKLTGMR